MIVGYVLYVLYGPLFEPEIIADDILTFEQCQEMKAVREFGAISEYPKFDCGAVIRQ